MTIEYLILLCVIIAGLSFCLGRKVGEAMMRCYVFRDYEIVEAFAINLVHCTIGATLRSRIAGDNSIEELAEILKPLKSHRKCMLEILPELVEFDNKMKAFRKVEL